MTAVFSHGRLRLYLLKLLDDGPKHGYELIRLLEDRFLGLYAPSAGTIYPRLQRLEAEGLVTHTAAGGRKIYEITEAGRAELRQRADELATLEADITASVEDLSALAGEIQTEVRGSVRDLKRELREATRQTRQGRWDAAGHPPPAPRPAPAARAAAALLAEFDKRLAAFTVEVGALVAGRAAQRHPAPYRDPAARRRARRAAPAAALTCHAHRVFPATVQRRRSDITDDGCHGRYPDRGATARRRGRPQHPRAALRQPALRRVRRGHRHQRQRGAHAAKDHRPDLVVLDVMLPDLDGFEVIRLLREGGTRTPVVFLTARDATDDKIRGLTLGGDDYVTKPFSLEELTARIRAVLRRTATGEQAPSRLTFADLELDEETHEVLPGRPAGAALADRVQAAALPDAQRQPGAVQGADPRPRVELRLPRRRQHRRVLHLLPAPQGRQRPAPADPHPARRRVRAAQAGGVSAVATEAQGPAAQRPAAGQAGRRGPRPGRRRARR